MDRIPLPKGGELRKVFFDREDLDRHIEAWKEKAVGQPFASIGVGVPPAEGGAYEQWQVENSFESRVCIRRSAEEGVPEDFSSWEV